MALVPFLTQPEILKWSPVDYDIFMKLFNARCEMVIIMSSSPPAQARGLKRKGPSVRTQSLKWGWNHKLLVLADRYDGEDMMDVDDSDS